MAIDERDNLLLVDNLSITFSQRGNKTEAVKNISFDLRKGQRLGIVGESGSGKSVTSLSILKLISSASSEVSGTISFNYDGSNLDIQQADQKQLYKIRGRKISMIFQEPMNTLNPVRTCGSQVKEVLDVHDIKDKGDRRAFVLSLFDKVQLSDVDRIYTSYPHELSGGQLQRVCIAMAIATSPDILICDEPTTALDVTIQKDIVDLIKGLTTSDDLSLIFISHDLDVVAELCDSVLVMYKGEIVEKGDLPATFLSPKHAYTKALLLCKPTPDRREYKLSTVQDVLAGQTQTDIHRTPRDTSIQAGFLEVADLKVYFPHKRSWPWEAKKYVKAVDGVTFDLGEKEILGIVGESGSGKSTVAKAIAGLLSPTEGAITYRGKDLTRRILQTDKKLRTQIQLVFQDPYSSLNPQMTIGAALREPVRYHKIVPRDQVSNYALQLLEEVGLDASYDRRYPHQLSGGQRQRVCIARALSVQPKLLICDESVSALDVSIQAQILNLLDELRSKRDISMLFISHDLSVVHYLCDRILVMKDGLIVEKGASDQVMYAATHPYTQKLISSIPTAIGT